MLRISFALHFDVRTMLGFIYLSLVATILAIMGTTILFRRISLFIHGAQASGTLVRWEAHGLRKKYFHPVVRFIAHDGTEYEFVGGPGRTKKSAERSYRVIYPSGAPNEAMVYSLLGFWVAPFAFLILAAGTTFAAIQQYPNE